LNVPILTKLYFSGSKAIADCGRGCGEWSSSNTNCQQTSWWCQGIRLS
jgi:hypothetical protein